MIVLLLLGLVAAPHWQDLRASLGAARLDPRWGGLAVVFAATYYVIAFTLWKRTLLLAGMRLSDREVADTWVPGLLARYIPGKIWSNGIRLAVARRLGSPLLSVTSALGWEALLAIATAAGFGLLLFRDWPESTWKASAITVLLVSSGALLAARLVAGRRLPSWLQRLGLQVPAIDSWQLVRLAGLNLLAWSTYGTYHWALARAVLPAALANLPSIAGAVALAWLGGFLAIVMPAGIGVREGVLVLLLGRSLGAGPAVVIAAASRLLSIGLDLAITAVWARAHGLAPKAPSPPCA